MEAIAAYVGGSGAMMVCHDLAQGEHWQWVGGLDSDISRLYLDRYADNVFARETMRRGPGLYTAHELADLAVHRRTAFMADIWAPQRIENLVQMAHPALTTKGTAGGFAVAMTARTIDDLPHIERRWKRIAPQLRLAADLYLAQGGRQMTPAPAGLLTLLPEAAFLVNASGCILGTNADGDTLLARGRGLRARPGGLLSATDQTDCRRLREAIARAALADRAGSVFRLNDPDRMLMSNAYTYDKVGNVMSVVNSAPIPGSGIGGRMAHYYQYDGLYRLA
ncbi:MAG: hypothetical protein K2X31_06780, partial [Sphingopyxis sp.]|nr:hypothetical protein [Sphingopyxis sp.]